MCVSFISQEVLQYYRNKDKFALSLWGTVFALHLELDVSYIKNIIQDKMHFQMTILSIFLNIGVIHKFNKNIKNILVDAKMNLQMTKW